MNRQSPGRLSAELPRDHSNGNTVFGSSQSESVLLTQERLQSGCGPQLFPMARGPMVTVETNHSIPAATGSFKSCSIPASAVGSWSIRVSSQALAECRDRPGGFYPIIAMNGANASELHKTVSAMLRAGCGYRPYSWLYAVERTLAQPYLRWQIYPPTAC
jgi:hypothetical protein